MPNMGVNTSSGKFDIHNLIEPGTKSISDYYFSTP